MRFINQMSQKKSHLIEMSVDNSETKIIFRKGNIELIPCERLFEGVMEGGGGLKVKSQQLQVEEPTLQTKISITPL